VVGRGRGLDVIDIIMIPMQIRLLIFDSYQCDQEATSTGGKLMSRAFSSLAYISP
jgi:hypothetical protein